MAGEAKKNAPYVLAVNQDAAYQVLLEHPSLTLEQFIGLYSPEQIQRQAAARRVQPESVVEGMRYDYIALQNGAEGARKAAASTGLPLNSPEVLKARDEQAGLAFKALEESSKGFSFKFWDVLQNETARSVTEGVVGGGLAAIVGGLLGGKKAILPAAVVGAVGMLVARHLFKDEKGVPYLDKAWSWLQQRFQSGRYQEIEAAKAQIQGQATGMHPDLAKQWQAALEQPWKTNQVPMQAAETKPTQPAIRAQSPAYQIPMQAAETKMEPPGTPMWGAPKTIPSPAPIPHEPTRISETPGLSPVVSAPPAPPPSPAPGPAAALETDNPLGASAPKVRADNLLMPDNFKMPNVLPNSQAVA